MGRGGVGLLEGFVGRLILCFRPRFDRARTGDFLLSKKYAASGRSKCWGLGIAGVVSFRPRFNRFRTGDFLAEQKIRGCGIVQSARVVFIPG